MVRQKSKCKYVLFCQEREHRYLLRRDHLTDNTFIKRHPRQEHADTQIRFKSTLEPDKMET